MLTINIVNQFNGENKLFGSDKGKAFHSSIMDTVAKYPNERVIGICLEGLIVVDVAFARDSVMAAASQLKGKKLFVILNNQPRVSSNWEYAAIYANIHVAVYYQDTKTYIGPKIGKVCAAIFDSVSRGISCRASSLALLHDISVQNACTQLKKLVGLGMLVREDEFSSSGRNEYIYKSY